jgi:hypothetical protein
MSRPVVCRIWLSFTFWFTLVFYGTFCWDRALWQGVAVHALPVWLTAQYVLWYTKLYRKCGRPLWLAVLSDATWHWLPWMVSLCLWERMPSLAGTAGVVALGLVYCALAYAALGSVHRLYDVPLPTLLAVYVPALALSVGMRQL